MDMVGRQMYSHILHLLGKYSSVVLTGFNTISGKDRFNSVKSFCEIQYEKERAQRPEGLGRGMIILVILNEGTRDKGQGEEASLSRQLFKYVKGTREGWFGCRGILQLVLKNNVHREELSIRD